jgi:hypothetical protein
MTLQVTRNLYGQGDAFGIHSTLRNQGNVMSAAGDEGALTFGADIYNDLNPFFSTVESSSRTSGHNRCGGMCRMAALPTP